MSSLIVEVCTVDEVRPHPNADRMAVAKVKGWTVCIRHDPESGTSQFAVGDRCVYFPPDTVIPHTLADRLGVTKYLGELAKDAEGNRPAAGRIKVAKLRGCPSYGLIIEAEKDWPAGTNVAGFYGATKWEPPMKATLGDAAPPHPAFHKYYDMENIRNFPDLFEPGEPVVVTEKIHGMNCRLGLVRDTDEAGTAVWRWMAGSHDVRRKPYATKTHRFDAHDLVAAGVLDAPVVEVGQLVTDAEGRHWRVDEVLPVDEADGRALFRATQVDRMGQEVQIPSEFWGYLSNEVRALLQHLAGCDLPGDPDGEPVEGEGQDVVLFGERFGSGIQAGYWYGLQNGRSAFRAFDIAVGRRYLDHDEKAAVLDRFGVPRVPVLYEGPFDFATIEELANGPSTVTEGDGRDDSQKVGREGVVVVSRVEGVAVTPQKVHDRRQLKCINFDYLARKGGTEYH